MDDSLLAEMRAAARYDIASHRSHDSWRAIGRMMHRLQIKHSSSATLCLKVDRL
jgi:hypothetical protein